MHRCIDTYIRTYVRTYRHTDIQTYRHTDIQTYRHTDIQTYRQTYRQTDIQTYRHTDRHTDRQTYRHTDIQTYRHTDIQTYRQTYRQTYIHTYRHTYVYKDRYRFICYWDSWRPCMFRVLKVLRVCSIAFAVRLVFRVSWESLAEGHWGIWAQEPQRPVCFGCIFFGFVSRNHHWCSLRPGQDPTNPGLGSFWFDVICHMFS